MKRRAREKQYEKIKEYAVFFNVDESMIYALLSEYKGMQKIKIADIEDDKAKEDGKGKKGTKHVTKLAFGLDHMNKNEIDSELLIVEPPSENGGISSSNVKAQT